MTARALRRPRSLFPDVVRVISGNFLEMYDFMVFGYYASAIAATFFPADTPFASLMLTMMTFGAGFLMRPLGALVLGAYIDRCGRRAGLVLTLGLITFGTLTIACAPGYATLGLLAPALVLAGRLLQGFSAGVELGGVSVYLAEVAPAGRKGLYISWQSASQQLAVIFAALLGMALNRYVGEDMMSRWGWRIPFIVGCMILPCLFWIRRMLEESEAFQKRRPVPRTREIFRSVARSWPLIGLGVCMVAATTVSFYMITAFTPTYGKAVLHFSAGESFIVTLGVGLSNLFWLPRMGTLSDKIGRRPLLLTFTSLMLLTAYPVLYWLAAAPSMPRLIAAELWLSFLYAGYNAAMVVTLTEIMPPAVRATGFSIAYSLAAAVFGGFNPAIASVLIHESGDNALPGAWLSLAALLGLMAALRLPTSYREGAVDTAYASPAMKTLRQK
ncbi:MFS transporter [Candidatus Sodalis endolongispinus]|uniref:MFS transporter n=2 Tax=Candidatus Sodalis endolongispinus TaxID=2812662 RepID=A0ABS5Y801_9GAMM|nr:MFS transporter [Candidatus Sodalis endolongispinus]MBT9431131.1 MFS transporter [Candidatus Sodalis endolongispinus]